MMSNDQTAGVDRLLVVEAVLALVFFGLAVAFFLIPAATPGSFPGWWVGFMLAVLFFAIVLLETFRRHVRGRTELRRVLDGQTPGDPSRDRDPDVS